ncbi:MAG TPA: neutral/alkaline non-lysosomal ceramidase N-terminal domain-containing protein [Gemmataceae bacterium]|nr:neutral/alkaline non-lysosomal ceramidase N-terminal domain-containing protein [Gemmataceae bacterium]
MKKIIGLAHVLILWYLPGAIWADELQAGTAKVTITPPTGFPMWGYGARHDQPSTGVRDQLYARALVLSVGKEKVALVSLDLGRPPTRTSTASIRRRINEGAGITTCFLVASHTHHGPVLELDNWPTPEKPYVRALEDKLVGAILEAARNLEPAQIGFGTAEVGLNRNRHARGPEKPVDRELLVGRVETTRGKNLAYLVNFAAHATLLDAKLRDLSADYPGAMARSVEQKTGGVCLFLQGAAGDLSAKPGQPDGPNAFGAELAAKVLEVGKTIQCSLRLPKGLQSREHTFTFGKRIDLANPLIRSAFSMAFFKELIDFYEREYREGIKPTLTTTLVDERIGLVGVSGEFFCSHALHLKKRARLQHLLFLGYCNDYHQYFPTIEAIGEGGYGADAQVSPVEIGAGERIMDQALIDLLEMRGKIRK